MRRRGRLLALVVAVAAAGVVVVLATDLGDRVRGTRTADIEEVKTGVGRVETLNCDGTPFRVGGHDVSGSGFLIGTRVVMTAEHGMWIGLGRRACKMRVRFGSGLYDVADVRVWSENGEDDRRGIDVATLTLTRPAMGHVFTIAPTGAPAGSQVATIGYPLGRLKVSRGTLTNLIDYGKPTLAAKLEGPPEGGNSGGPIINDAGEVLSVFSRAVITANVTRDRRHRLGGIDLPRWWRDDAYPDLCRAHPDGGIPDCDLSSTSRPGKSPVVLPPPR